ncbi:hypothetical protein M752DRAFT_284646 [Aspergillus phoenicis ATCC 13157]|uniref:Uncharacterized protein n=1 Tax=Aspergillus phoenicis ATCC 13157 TaxID=1353007 RepID=A0A370PG51_ASPPH|nr:hypothetical protein M752DRAFT_284646 [Aspergillus phoenicis ATCC 13157]
MVAALSRPFYWPGDIPLEIQIDPRGDIDPEEADDEAKGNIEFRGKWPTFPTKMVITRKGVNRLPQRRRAQHPPVLRLAALFVSRTPESIRQENRSRWIKLYILSCRIDGDMDSCLGHLGSRDGAIDVNPATHDLSAVQITDVLTRDILEMANLNFMTMIRNDDLDTGHITVVEFKRNGQVHNSFRRRACNMWPVYLEYCSAWRPLGYVIEQRVGVQSGHDLPLINILEGAKARDEFLFGFDGARDGWMEGIEIYAPGNLEMKRQGMRLTTTIPASAMTSSTFTTGDTSDTISSWTK